MDRKSTDVLILGVFMESNKNSLQERDLERWRKHMKKLATYKLSSYSDETGPIQGDLRAYSAEDGSFSVECIMRVGFDQNNRFTVTESGRDVARVIERAVDRMARKLRMAARKLSHSAYFGVGAYEES